MQAIKKGFINYSKLSSIVFYKHMQIEDNYVYFKPTINLENKLQKTKKMEKKENKKKAKI